MGHRHLDVGPGTGYFIEKADPTRDTEKVAVADSFGIGVHALLIDEFQLDAYFGLGYSSGNKFDRGAALTIRQAF